VSVSRYKTAECPTVFDGAASTTSFNAVAAAADDDDDDDAKT